MNCLTFICRNSYRVANVRLTSLKYSSLLINANTTINSTNYNQYTQKHNFSLQSSVESFIKTQSGIFQSISESTPVGYFQKFVLTVHDTTGLPWWATIITSTIILRTCVTLPLSIYQNYILAKVENLHMEMAEIVKELKAETAMAIKMYKWDEKTTKYNFKRSVKKQWNNLIIRDNCHPFKASILIWFQLPMWICFSVAIRNLVYMLPKNDLDAQLTFLELSAGGFGWIPNLTEVDSSLILPLTMGLVNLAIIELQTLSKVRVPTRFQQNVTYFLRGLSIFMIPIGACVPSCLVLYWTTSSTYGLIQNLVTLSPKVKRICRIPQTPSELDKPYSHVLAGVKHRIHSIPGLSKPF